MEINKANNRGKSPGLCDENCLLNGLQYAKVLGEAAKTGADVLFIESHDISSLNANVFKQAIDKMHNALIGTRIFKVRSSKSSYDKKQSSVYGYCSKKMNGAVTMMGINYSNAREKINSKLSTSVESNSVILQYILSIADGNVMVNNEKYNGTLMPVYKFKKNSKFSIDLTIPPFSIAFWVLKNANEKECFNKLKSEEKNKIRTGSAITSSSDDLLKTLVANALRKENENSQRSKRQISNVSPLLPKFDFNFSNLVPSNINQRSIKDVFLNKNTEVYRVAPVETNPLQSSENPALPNGDVYLLIDDGTKDEYSDIEIQYPSSNNKKEQRKQLKLNKQLYQTNVKTDIPDEYLTSHDYIESKHKTSKKNMNLKKKTQTQQQKDVGELFETENMNIEYPKNYDQMRSSTNQNVEIKTITRELEPTYRQSKKAIIAAKRKWDQNQLMELLKDATLQEVDKSQIRDVNEFQIIDLSNNEDIPLDYEEYEDNDEDGFFSSDKHKIRTRRSIDYRINEIPRSENFLYDSKEDDSSVEDVHFYLHPRQPENKFQQSTTPTTKQESTIVVDENSPLGVKLIDVFSKSLDDIIFTVHKNLISWWYVFSPPNYE